MVRSEAQLVERMTLVWHDWFATSKDSATQGLMLRQNALLRRHALGSLRRGRYRLFCTLEGHRALGMRATLRVR